MTGTALIHSSHREYRSATDQFAIIAAMTETFDDVAPTRVFQDTFNAALNIHAIILMDNPAVQYAYYRLRQRGQAKWDEVEQVFMQWMEPEDPLDDLGLGFMGPKARLARIEDTMLCVDCLCAKHQWHIVFSKKFLSKLTYFKLTIP